MPNQFTKGTRTKHDQATKDQIACSMVRRRLLQFAKAKGHSADKYLMSAAQVAASKILMDRWLPVLSAVEQTQSDPWQHKSEAELISAVEALIRAHPELLAKLRSSLEPVRESSPGADQPQTGVSEAA